PARQSAGFQQARHLQPLSPARIRGPHRQSPRRQVPASDAHALSLCRLIEIQSNVRLPLVMRFVPGEEIQHVGKRQLPLLEEIGNPAEIFVAKAAERLQEVKLALADVLNLLAWHEAHHQGQTHITLNLYKATQT